VHKRKRGSVRRFANTLAEACLVMGCGASSVPPSPAVTEVESNSEPSQSDEKPELPRASRARLEPLDTSATIDPAYLEVAEATGGRVIRSLRPGSGGTSRLAAFRGPVPERLRLPFVVVPTISSLSITAKGEGSMNMRLLDPEGGVLELATTRPGRADYRVSNLPRGTWNVDVIAARGQPLDVEVQCETSLSVRVRTKQAGGRPGHMGWFSLVGRPTFERRYLLEVEPRHGKELQVSELELGLSSTTGGTRWLETSPLSGRVAGWAALASFHAGDRVVVRGRLAQGERFSRLATAPHPSPFLIEPVNPAEDRLLDEVLVPTRDRALHLRVQRTGSSGPAVFRVQGSELTGTVEPEVLDLADGTPEQVVLRARASPEAPAPATTATLTVSVGAELQDRESNTFVLTARVGRDRDGDGFSDETEQVDGKPYDGDGDGTPDLDQGEVATFSELLSVFSVRFQPDAVLTRFERTLLLGRDLPAGVREAPFGAWRVGVGDAAQPTPAVLRIHLSALSMQRVDTLLVFDATTQRWQVRSRVDAPRRRFELSLGKADQQQLRTGNLTLAVAH